MQIRKIEAAGRLFLQTLVSAGCMPKASPRARRERRKITSEGKRKINAVNRKYELMLLMGANFRAGRDLFIELSYAQEPSPQEVKNALSSFHRRMKRQWEKYGVKYKYIIVDEMHGRDGQPVRLHHHLIVSGVGRLALGRIIKAWGQGGVNVQLLRELTDNFEDTCRYLLKERREAGAKRYRTSRNVTRPPEPLRSRIPDSEVGEVPPGVKLVQHEMRDSEFGRYEIMVGKIVDVRLFGAWMDRQKERERMLQERNYWRKFADARRAGRYKADGI